MKVLIPWLPSGYNQTYGQKRLKQAAKVYAGADYVLSNNLRQNSKWPGTASSNQERRLNSRRRAPATDASRLPKTDMFPTHCPDYCCPDLAVLLFVRSRGLYTATQGNVREIMGHRAQSCTASVMLAAQCSVDTVPTRGVLTVGAWAMVGATSLSPFTP